MADQEIFKVLKSALITNESVSIDNWSVTFKEMIEQSVASLPGEWLKKQTLPREAESWLKYCTLSQGKWLRIMFEQEQLLRLLEKHNIPCVIIKGSSAAMAYPIPSLREMGDIDFLVKRSDYEKTATLLESNGFLLLGERDAKDHHYKYVKNRVVFELHKRLAIVSDSDERLLSLFEKGIEDRIICECEGFRFPALPPELNGLVLLFHINQHIRGGIGLRQIIDWMMYIDKLPVNTWQDSVLPVLKETGMERFALALTAMCQKYLGLRTIVDNIEEYPCDELMGYILDKGNFGRKSGFEGKTESFTLLTKDMSRLFQRLQAGGMKNWKTAHNHKVLRPFAWFYQVIHIVREISDNRIGPHEIIKQRRQGKEQRKLIESLGLDIDRMIKP